VRFRDGAQVALRLRHRDVQRLLAGACTLEQKLQRKGRFPDARIALYEIDVIAREAALENVVESLDPGCSDAF
jgi:hypothetical protein